MGTALLGELEGRVKIPLGVGVRQEEGPLRVDVWKVGRLASWSPVEGSDSVVGTEEVGRDTESLEGRKRERERERERGEREREREKEREKEKRKKGKKKRKRKKEKTRIMIDRKGKQSE